MRQGARPGPAPQRCCLKVCRGGPVPWDTSLAMEVMLGRDFGPRSPRWPQRTKALERQLQSGEV